ncbi:MAG: xanthine dehydrogenase family protein molybdopterin-binding subunit [Pseudomonadota bacterium]
MGKHSIIGKAVPRIDALEKVTGKTKYTCDIVFPGMLFGCILRSPLAHAKIVRIDTRRAQNLPGVRAVVTGGDFPDLRYGMLVKDQRPLARGRVRYVGERVAAVAAIDLETARAAIGLIDVEYEELEPVFDPFEALKPGAVQLHEDIGTYSTTIDSIVKYNNVCSRSGVRRGDVEKGFSGADLIFEDTFTTPMVHQAYLEPHSVIARVEATGKVVVLTMTPAVFNFRDELAETLGLPTSRVKVIGGPVGGSFGGKNDMRLEPICARLAQKSGAVVKMTLERDEEFTDGAPRHASVIRLKTGVMKDGTIIARRARMVFDTGAYAEFGPAVASEAAKQIGGPYRIPNLDVESLCVYTNKVSCGCFRSHGTPQPTFAYESQMDIIAAGLGMDPLEIRLRNAVVDGVPSATGEIYRDICLEENLRRAAAQVRWGNEKKGVCRGRGIACGQWRTGGRPTTIIVKLDEHGKVTVTTGCIDVSSSNTVICQVVAEELGIGMSDIQIIPVDTDNAPFDAGSSGTRTTHVVGGAAREAAALIREKMFDVAAGMLESDRGDLEIEKGEVFVKGAPSRGIPLAQVARRSFLMNGGPAIVSVSSPGRLLPIDPGAVEGLCFGGAIEFIHPVQVAEVEVDPETGRVKVTSFTSVHDIGKAINPDGVLGQISGAVAQGIGYALFEEISCRDGVILNPGIIPYPQPGAGDIPKVNPVLLEDKPGLGPYGAKGIAEGPIIPTAPAIANAVYDAVGVRIKSLPITPEKILKAMRESMGGDG